MHAPFRAFAAAEFLNVLRTARKNQKECVDGKRAVSDEQCEHEADAKRRRWRDHNNLVSFGQFQRVSLEDFFGCLCDMCGQLRLSRDLMPRQSKPVSFLAQNVAGQDVVSKSARHASLPCKRTKCQTCLPKRNFLKHIVQQLPLSITARFEWSLELSFSQKQNRFGFSFTL